MTLSGNGLIPMGLIGDAALPSGTRSSAPFMAHSVAPEGATHTIFSKTTGAAA